MNRSQSAAGTRRSLRPFQALAALGLVLATASLTPAFAAGKPAADASAKAAKGGDAAEPAGKVNVNTATQEQLETLPGVGPSLALRILDYRKQNGPFKSADDLRNVKGIGDKSFERIRPFIIVTAEK